MAITKKYLKTKPVCKVTFELENTGADHVFVAGYFNNWKENDLGLKKLKSGTFKGDINLPKGEKYEFKYLIDGNWANEKHADAHLQNEFGTENSVLSV